MLIGSDCKDSAQSMIKALSVLVYKRLDIDTLRELGIFSLGASSV